MDKHENNAQTIFEKGRQSSINIADINGVQHALVPKDCELKSLENLMPKPVRIKATPNFDDIVGFAEYIDEFKEDGSRVFVDEDSRSFMIVFDCHHKGSPAWGDHKAVMKLKYSNEWVRFSGFNEKKMTGLEFAEFIEDNIEYIYGNDLTGADLLSMAQSMKVSLKGNLEVDASLHSGLRKLTIKDDHVLSGRSGSKDISFPEKLKLRLRVYRGSDTYPIEAYLRYRVTKESVTFWIKIIDAEGIQEAAFLEVINKLKALTGLPVLLGSY